jgi:hypothetical protein
MSCFIDFHSCFANWLSMHASTHCTSTEWCGWRGSPNITRVARVYDLHERCGRCGSNTGIVFFSNPQPQMVASHFLDHARCDGVKYVHYVFAFLQEKTKSSRTSYDSSIVQDCILRSPIIWLATAQRIEQRGFDTPPKYSYAIALNIEVSMYCVWNSLATYILLSVRFQVYVLEGGMLSTAS